MAPQYRVSLLSLVTLLLCLMSGRPMAAQQLTAARQVEVDASDISVTSDQEVGLLRERLQRFTDSFAPDVRLLMTPTEPVETTIYLRLIDGSGQRFRGDLTLTAYRPIYGRDEQSLLLLAMERAMPVVVPRESSFFPLRGAIPESIQGRRLYYYLTLTMMLYYDSFDTLGGQPFLDLLRRESGRLQDAWQDEVTARTVSLQPDQLLPELITPEGTRLRELWCLYHREVLDADPTDPRAEESLIYCLQELDRLRRSMKIPHLIQLFGDAKGREMQRWRDDSPEVAALLDELFPWAIAQ